MDQQLERLSGDADIAKLRAEYPDHWERYDFAAERIFGAVLDVACGPAFGTVRLSQVAGTSLVGADVDPAVVQQANSRFGDSARFVQVPVCGKWPFLDQQFDAVVSLETIEHVPDPRGFLDEIARVSRPQAVVILSTPLLHAPTTEPPANPYHLREYTWDEFGSLVGESLLIVERWTQVSRAGAVWNSMSTSPFRSLIAVLKSWLPQSFSSAVRRRVVQASGTSAGKIVVGLHPGGSVQLVVAKVPFSPKVHSGSIEEERS
jgi:SAM-dependent methyltransferase